MCVEDDSEEGQELKQIGLLIKMFYTTRVAAALTSFSIHLGSRWSCAREPPPFSYLNNVYIALSS